MKHGEFRVGISIIAESHGMAFIRVLCTKCHPKLFDAMEDNHFVVRFYDCQQRKGAGCLPKMRMWESGVHTVARENIPSKTCFDSHTPAIGLPLAPKMWQALVRGPSVAHTWKVML